MKKVDKAKLTTVDFLELMLNWNALVLCEERPKTAVIILLPAPWMETIIAEREETDGESTQTRLCAECRAHLAMKCNPNNCPDTVGSNM